MTDSQITARLTDTMRACGTPADEAAHLAKWLRVVVDQAVAEERERCAKIADGEGRASAEPAAKAAARPIAAVIRSPTTAGAGG